MEIDRHETARRMRALRGYSLMGQAEFADAIGVPRKDAERYMRTSGATRAPEDVLRRAAEVAGLPSDFALGEFGSTGADPGSLNEEKVRALIAIEVAAAMRRDLPELDATRPESDGKAS